MQKLYVTNRVIQLNSFGAKNVMLPTGEYNWPPLMQKRYVTNRGIQLTSFGAKTLRYEHMAPTDLLDV